MTFSRPHRYCACGASFDVSEQPPAVIYAWEAFHRGPGHRPTTRNGAKMARRHRHAAERFRTQQSEAGGAASLVDRMAEEGTA